MGLLAFLRGRSSKDIRLKQDISKYLVFPYPLKSGKVWLNKKAIVPENTILAFCSRGKVLDILPTGEHTLGAVVLPNCSSKFKLYRLDKDGKALTNFKGFAYFIDLSPKTNFGFSTYKKIKYENEIDKKFAVKLEFVMDYQIKEPKRILKCLFSEYAYLKNGEAEDILERWLSEFVTDELEKNAYRRADFEQRLPEIQELLSAKLKKQLENIGLEETNLKTTAILSRDKNEKTNPLANSQDFNEYSTTDMLEKSELLAEQQYEQNEFNSVVSSDNLPKTNIEIADAKKDELKEEFAVKNITLQEKNIELETEKKDAIISTQIEKIEKDNSNLLEENALKAFEKALNEEENSLNLGWRGLESMGENDKEKNK